MGYSDGNAKVSVSAFVLALSFYIMAFGLSIVAEKKLSSATVKYDGMMYFCQYKANISTGLAGFAFVFLGMAHLVVMGLTRCLCCGGSLKPGKNRVFVAIIFFFCWICCIIAEACLLAGASRNAMHTKAKDPYNAMKCEHIQRGVFSSGAAFTLFSAILGLSYYLLYVNTLEDLRSTLQSQVSMAAYPQPTPYAGA